MVLVQFITKNANSQGIALKLNQALGRLYICWELWHLVMVENFKYNIVK